ncbi:hypothetical protein FA13DRAFT_792702 [Coprinellus micaceus]|uniref:F-box domain-containing protein n=1 Tax=Coprinellus micaceus TaxID=71717 RepID=A0A4Y7T2R4_COPMI|nr:hypothetical protein FA13DRAFT_792702 [Coprinellus micaceus]
MLRIRQTWRDLVARSYSPPARLFAFRLPGVYPPEAAQKTAPQRVVSIDVLPAEVIDHVFDLLDGEPDTIKTCTLVCQKWRVLSQPRLFRSIVLATEDLSQSIQFQQFMLQSPNIRAGVREITVHFPDLASWPPDRKLAANLMADILELLPRPESLRLYGARFSDYRVKWSRLSNHLKNSIRTILHRPTMAHLLIDGWVLDVNHPLFNDIFATASHSLTSISLLDISDGIWGTADIPQPPSSAPRLALEKLTVSNTFTKDMKMIEWLCRPESVFDLQQLKALHVVESRDDDSVSLLTNTIGASLERLEVNISYTPQESIGLNHSTSLRSLSLSFGVFYTELYYSSIPWICETLDTLPEDNQLDELSLSLYITHPRNATQLFPPPPVGRFNYDRWARLGAKLSDPKFGGVERVKIQLVHHGIDARGYSMMAAQRLGEVTAPKVTWRYLRDDSPDVDPPDSPAS